MRKFFKRFFITVFVFLAIVAGTIYVSGKTYLFTALTYWFAEVDDYTIFKNNTVTTGTPQEWPVSETFNKLKVPDSLNSELEKFQSLALVVIHKDSLLYEQYWKGYSDSSWSGSFSVAKSVVSILIGAAIQDGLIGSVMDPVGKYLPEWNEGDKAAVRIKDLLTMSSGTNWSESYKNPLSVTTEAYYGTDLQKTIGRLKMVDKPGTKFIYKSGDTQILGFILNKVTGKSLAALAAEKLWHPLGAEHPALWSIDKIGGDEKAYCCFNTNARDFARIGQLMLDSGVWNGQRIIPEQYYLESITPSYIPDEEQFDNDYYGYQWWIYPKVPGVFYARGILGQFIIVIPQKDMVIVRLGEQMGDIYRYHTPEIVQSLVDWGLSL